MENQTQSQTPSLQLRPIRRWLKADIKIERLPDSYRKTIRRLEGKLQVWKTEYRPYTPEKDDTVTRDRWPEMPELLRIWIAGHWLIRISPGKPPIPKP
jgi:hypothetical protein